MAHWHIARWVPGTNHVAEWVTVTDNRYEAQRAREQGWDVYRCLHPHHATEYTRSEIEHRARAFLERARGSGPSRLTPAQWEALVRQEIALTIRQLRAIARPVVDR